MNSTPTTERTAPPIKRRQLSSTSSFLQQSSTELLVHQPVKDRDEGSIAVSQWGIGWKTPLVMGCAFLLDGKDEIAHQSYVLIASNILASAFGLSINVALALAFCQYLWRVVRLSAIKISTLEALFSLRSNPFLLVRADALQAAPFLFLLAIFMWGIQIAVNFPTGAVTVVQANQTSFSNVTVPTFNASFMGNGSAIDAQNYYLGGPLVVVDPSTPSRPGCCVVALTSLFPVTTPLLPIVKLANRVMVTGEPLSMPSPCGLNCSYTIQFEGPWLECASNTSIDYILPSNVSSDFGLFTVYTSNNSYLDSKTSYLNSATFTKTQYWPIAANNDQLGFYALNQTNASVGSVIMLKTTLSCTSWRVKYILRNSYENNTQSIDITTQKIASLKPSAFSYVDNLWPNGTASGVWTNDSIAWYRDNNMLAVVQSVFQWLDGTVTAPISITGPFNETSPLESSNNITITNPLLGDGDDLWTYQVGWVNALEISSAKVFETSSSNILVTSSRFYNLFEKYSLGAYNGQDTAIDVTQDTLNSLILNMTLSVMVAYDLWTTETNATIRKNISVFSLSRPLNIFLPYLLSLVLAIPFLTIGIIALLRNGVSAVDGGFIQLLTTTTGSVTLNRAAAGNCLGGNGKISNNLKELRIKFGELIEDGIPPDHKVPRRACFGTEEEIKLLRKQEAYGIKAKREN